MISVFQLGCCCFINDDGGIVVHLQDGTWAHGGQWALDDAPDGIGLGVTGGNEVSSPEFCRGSFAC